MINRLFVYESPSHDPYFNLAVEQHLLESVTDSAILYLWRNENTVVIGRNQNPWKECATALLAEEGGRLARRLSGGGAVFHDLGNLNFTFLVPQSDYDVPKQTSVIMEAVSSFGIEVELSGRNDILAQGRKFSGNAYYKNGRQAYHHGTILVDVDMDKLNRYLRPSKAKLQSKGVDSVRSRVVNLKELNGQITIPDLKEALKAAFSQVYGMQAEPVSGLDMTAVAVLTERNRSWDWLYGRKIPFTCTFEERFPWGGVQIGLEVEKGVIRQARVYTDAMDIRWAAELETALTGCRFEKQAMLRALPESVAPEDIRKLLARQEI